VSIVHGDEISGAWVLSISGHLPIAVHSIDSSGAVGRNHHQPKWSGVAPLILPAGGNKEMANGTDSFDSNKGSMKNLRGLLSAWIILIAIVLAGGAMAANTSCVNGQCFTCDGSMACSGGTCTCNGAPAQRVPAPGEKSSAAPANAALDITFVNNSSSTIVYHAFYAADRSMTWPGANQKDGQAGIGQPGMTGASWTSNYSKGQERVFHLQCTQGQSICWAAWNDDIQRKGSGGWGAGIRNSVSCEHCCYRCGAGTPRKQILD
jgi:hypothetical protein